MIANNISKRWFLLSLLMALLISWGAMVWESADAASLAPSAVFSAELSGMQEVPMNNSMGHGHAVFVLDSDMTTVHYRLMVGDLTGVTAAHIHVGAVGATGGPVPAEPGAGATDRQAPHALRSARVRFHRAGCGCRHVPRQEHQSRR